MSLFDEKEASLRNSKGRSKLVVFFVALAMVVAVGAAALAGPAPLVKFGGSRWHDGVARVVVELGLKPTAVVYREKLGVTSLHGSANAAAMSHHIDVESEQRSFRSTLSHSGLTGVSEIFSLQRSFNGIAYITTPDKVQQLAKLPGVKAVHPLPLHELNNAHSVPFIGAVAAWSRSTPLTGQGIRVGVIDTGIDYLHKNFGGSGLQEDYVANDPSVPNPTNTTPDITFPTLKVIGGIDLAGAAYHPGDGVPAHEVPVVDYDPMDFVGHGTHVSGTIAGYGVKTNGTTYGGPYDDTAHLDDLYIGPGVAPLASLYAIKVFGDTEGSTGLAAQAIEWALDPNQDTSFSDHLDVVNLSLGSGFGTAADVESVVYRNAVGVGLTIVAAAGNAYDTYFVSGDPGSIPEVLSVAAAQHDWNPYLALRINLPTPAKDVPAGYPEFGPSSYPSVTGYVMLASPLTGCTTPAANAYAGKVVLVQKGGPSGCYGHQKVMNAQAGNAIGVIVYDSVDEAIGYMGDRGLGTPTIPSLFVRKVDGDALKAAIDASSQVNVTFDASLHVNAAGEADNLASFSSRGPSRVLNQPLLKPDVAAPGYAIWSSVPSILTPSFVGSPGDLYYGTSMATPHVTGTVALLRELHPGWSVPEIKALVMNTANHDTYLNDWTNPRPVMGPQRGGSGRVDVAQATDAAVLAYDKDYPERVSISFATTDVVTSATELRTVQLHNKSTTDGVTYDVTFVPIVQTAGVSLTLSSNSVQVPANAYVDFGVTLQADATTMLHDHDTTISEMDALYGASYGLHRYWLSEFSGHLVFTPQSGPALRVPVYAAPTPASDMHAAGPLGATGPTGMANLAVDGTPVLTASTQNPPPYGVVSLVTPFELLHSSPNTPPITGSYPDGFDVANTDGSDLRYFGVTSDLKEQGGTLANTTLSFGVVSWGRVGFTERSPLRHSDQALQCLNLGVPPAEHRLRVRPDQRVLRHRRLHVGVVDLRLQRRWLLLVPYRHGGRHVLRPDPRGERHGPAGAGFVPRADGQRREPRHSGDDVPIDVDVGPDRRDSGDALQREGPRLPEPGRFGRSRPAQRLWLPAALA